MASIRKIKLEEPDLAQLLTDLEATGFPLKDIDINALLKKKSLFYGPKSSDRCTAFRRKFSQLKRTSIKSYRKSWLMGLHVAVVVTFSFPFIPRRKLP
jgi:hypothetical protein